MVSLACVLNTCLILVFVLSLTSIVTPLRVFWFTLKCNFAKGQKTTVILTFTIIRTPQTIEVYLCLVNLLSLTLFTEDDKLNL